MVFGANCDGSGDGATSEPPAHCPYPDQVGEMLGRLINRNITISNLAKRGATTEGMAPLLPHLLPRLNSSLPITAVFMDFSVNDAYFTWDLDRLKLSLEVMMRYMKEHWPSTPLISLDTYCYPRANTTSNLHLKFAEHYQVPVLSYRDLVVGRRFDNKLIWGVHNHTIKKVHSNIAWMTVLGLFHLLSQYEEAHPSYHNKQQRLLTKPTIRRGENQRSTSSVLPPPLIPNFEQLNYVCPHPLSFYDSGEIIGSSYYDLPSNKSSDKISREREYKEELKIKYKKGVRINGKEWSLEIESGKAYWKTINNNEGSTIEFELRVHSKIVIGPTISMVKKWGNVNMNYVFSPDLVHSSTSQPTTKTQSINSCPDKAQFWTSPIVEQVWWNPFAQGTMTHSTMIKVDLNQPPPSNFKLSSTMDTTHICNDPPHKLKHIPNANIIFHSNNKHKWAKIDYVISC